MKLILLCDWDAAWARNYRLRQMFAFMCWPNLGGLRSADRTKKVISIIPTSLNQLDPNGVLVQNFIVCTWASGGSAIPGCQTLNGRKAWLVWLSLVTWDIYGTGIPQTKMTRPRRQKTVLTFLRSTWAGLPLKHRKPTAVNMYHISPHEVDEWIDIR